jgi:hypothetical protein|tara:strand:- start:10412 stop:10825 length:414 start_codon:yes stop_codon:yes gene_type:complete
VTVPIINKDVTNNLKIQLIMKNFKTLLLLCLTVLLFNCNADDDQAQVNNNPSDFTLTEGVATADGITFNWTASVDPDNQDVVYAIYLNGDLLSDNLTVLTYIIDYNLFVGGEDTIVVVASDGFGGVTEQQIIVNLIS